MILLAENETFKVEHEYEEVYLYNKRKKKSTLIGDYNISSKVCIKDENAIGKFMDYFNSLEVIRDTSRINEYLNDKYIFVYFQNGSSVSIYGSYISILEPDDCDCDSIEYYICNSGFNPITGNSNVSEFLDDLIYKYDKETS